MKEIPLKEIPLNEETQLYFSLPQSSEAYCCYSCELYIRVGQQQGPPFWCDIGGEKWEATGTTYLVCAECCTQHCLIHFACDPLMDRLYYHRDGPRSITLDTEDPVKRSQWIMKRELARLRSEGAQLERSVGNWTKNRDDMVRSSQPLRLNLLPGKSCFSSISVRMERASEILGYIALLVVVLPFIVLELGQGSLKRLRRTAEVERREKEERERVHKVWQKNQEVRRRGHQKKVEALREFWPLLRESLTPYRSYLNRMSNIPLVNKTERAVIGWDLLGRYRREVIAALSCGFCGATGKLCYEWNRPDCPRCGKAELDWPPSRYSVYDGFVEPPKSTG